ncbi:TlpA disulfide reductase family protein [Sinorhizobium meliloti]|uniref:TlpA disulfide reductase family protein n=1 Tax=Rhizobium meliloti TaxID=382 RepID=UPI001F29A231|nr:TlpA disulfide reductase family protein [Sinorhizobium meliloti]
MKAAIPLPTAHPAWKVAIRQPAVGRDDGPPATKKVASRPHDAASAMPGLIELQERYKDSGVEVVAVAADERAASADEARTKLDAWLAQFPKLNFPVGLDDTGAMDTLWMKPSFSVGIPQAFVIDRDGYLAFIGHPGKLHEVLPQVLDGTWRTSAQAKAAERKRIAVDEPKARKHALKKQIKDKIAAAEEIKDWKTVLDATKRASPLIWTTTIFARLKSVWCLIKCATWKLAWRCYGNSFEKPSREATNVACLRQ